MKTSFQQHKAVIAACKVALDRKAPNSIQLLPAGRFRARDGRPYGVPEGWLVDDLAAQLILEHASNTQSDCVIDYEHQTLNAEFNGQPAPAAGWWQTANMEWRENDGLYATKVSWTDKARVAIEAGEYRYISPVLAFDPDTGRVTAILMAALTNYPALDQLDGLAERAAARFDFTQPDQEDSTVNREQLIQLLGLDAGVTDDKITTTLKAAKASHEQIGALRGELGLVNGDDIKTSIAALKAAAEPDPGKYVPLAQFESLKTELASLRADTTQRDVDALVAQGINDGKLQIGNQADWARQLGKKSIADLKSYLDTTPVIDALKHQQSGGEAPPEGAGGSTELSADQLAICKATGIDPDTYKQQLADDASA